MDFEDGKRRPWLVASVGGRRGGLRWGSVYRLKMAVWALFCGPQAARPPPAAGPVPRSAPVGPALPPPTSPRPPGFRCPRGPGSSVPTWAGKDAPRARRPPDSGAGLAPAPVRGNCPDASNFPVSGKAAGRLPLLACTCP